MRGLCPLIVFRVRRLRDPGRYGIRWLAPKGALDRVVAVVATAACVSDQAVTEAPVRRGPLRRAGGLFPPSRHRGATPARRVDTGLCLNSVISFRVEFIKF